MVTRDETKVSVGEKNYRDMSSSLLHRITSHPDIIFSVCLCA